MQVIERPIFSSTALPPGTLVIIRIDPVACVALLNDEQATREAAALTATKILALYVGDVMPGFSEADGGVRVNGKFRFAARGLPDAPFSDAAVPIFPAPALALENGQRVPIKTPLEVPWDDCYIHTLDGVYAYVNRIFKETDPAPISDDALETFYQARREDFARFDDLLHEMYYEDDRGSSVLSASEDGTEESDEGSFLFMSRLVQNLLEPPVRQEVQLNVEMWVQVSPEDELGTPGEFLETMAALRRIGRAWTRRTRADKIAKQQQTTAWLAELPSHVAQDEEDATTKSEHEGECNELVRPEDAIDHRLENGATEEGVITRETERPQQPSIRR